MPGQAKFIRDEIAELKRRSPEDARAMATDARGQASGRVRDRSRVLRSDLADRDGTRYGRALHRGEALQERGS